MKSIIQAASVAVIALAVGVGLGVAGIAVRVPDADAGSMYMILMFVCWVVVTLMIGAVLPRRRRPAMISGVGRVRTVVTDQLKQAIVAAYIGDGQPSIRDVAQRLHCSYGTAWRVLSDAGVTRPRGITRLARTRRAATV